MPCHCKLPARQTLHGQPVFGASPRLSARRRSSPKLATRPQAVAVTQVPTSMVTERSAQSYHAVTRAFTYTQLVRRLLAGRPAEHTFTIHAEYGRQLMSSCKWRRGRVICCKSIPLRLFAKGLLVHLQQQWRLWYALLHFLKPTFNCIAAWFVAIPCSGPSPCTCGWQFTLHSNVQGQACSTLSKVSEHIVQMRAWTITTRLGGFALGLAWDRFTKQADTPERVRFRAAQLRQATTRCCAQHMTYTVLKLQHKVSLHLYTFMLQHICESVRPQPRKHHVYMLASYSATIFLRALKSQNLPSVSNAQTMDKCLRHNGGICAP